MLLNKDFSFIVSPVGIAWLALAVMAAVFYSILLKKLAMKYNPFLIIAMQNLIGTIYFLPLFLVFDYHNFVQVHPNAELITSLLLLAVFASSLAFVFFAISAREIGVSKTNLFTNLIPVFTAIFAFIILKEDFDIRKIAGMIIVIGGVFLSQVKQGKKSFDGN
jgi:drug/metabolite transporter (DMT)-like permease